MPAPPTEPLGLKIYRRASRAARPVVDFALNRRLVAGKEDAERIAERRGVASLARPEGELAWIHGVSVGESLSVLPLVERLRALRPATHFLVTTGTVTSASLMQERLPDGAFHQFVPLDHPVFDAAIFVESEFWPNLILEASRRAGFMALVNGRVSPRSFEDWKRQPRSIRFILSAFDTIIAQDYQNAERLMALSERPVEMLGNLKNAAPALPAKQDDVTALKAQFGARPVWLAASTHPGEEEIVFAAHKILKTHYPGILTIVAPRHPVRGGDVAELAAEHNIPIARRSKGETIDEKVELYIADTLGELGVFYRLCDIALVGGGLTPKGGHNPLEPARLGVAILHGPHIFNFVETYAGMRANGGAALVRNERELATAVRRLFADEKTRTAMAEAAKGAAEENAEKILADICDTLMGHFPRRLNGA